MVKMTLEEWNAYAERLIAEQEAAEQAASENTEEANNGSSEEL